jgi:hypothetical protein
MLQKLQIEDILMNIIPWSILFWGLLYLLDFDISNLESSNYVSSFVFTSLSYVWGELMKTISHLKIFEYPIKIFFKWHMPSEIRLTKNNPIVSNYSLEKNWTKYIWDYETLKLSLSKSKDSILDFNQSEFNSIYALVRNESNIRKSN